MYGSKAASQLSLLNPTASASYLYLVLSFIPSLLGWLHSSIPPHPSPGEMKPSSAGPETTLDPNPLPSLAPAAPEESSPPTSSTKHKETPEGCSCWPLPSNWAACSLLPLRLSSKSTSHRARPPLHHRRVDGSSLRRGQMLTQRQRPWSPR